MCEPRHSTISGMSLSLARLANFLKIQTYEGVDGSSYQQLISKLVCNQLTGLTTYRDYSPFTSIYLVAKYQQDIPNIYCMVQKSGDYPPGRITPNCQNSLRFAAPLLAQNSQGIKVVARKKIPPKKIKPRWYFQT